MPRSVTTPKTQPAKRRHGSKANTLAISVVFVGLVFTFAAILFLRTSNNARFTSRQINDPEAIRVAEAGIEKAVWCLNNPAIAANCPGNPSFIGETNATYGRGQYTSIVTGSGNNRTIDVTATVSGSGGTSTKHVQVKLAASSANVSFQYGVQTGIGGVILENNAYIDGNVYAGGSITGANGSYVNGDAILTPSDPILDQVSDPTSPYTTITFGSSNSTDDWVAQSFVPAVTERLFSVDFKIAKHNSPSSSVRIHVYDDSGNNPNNKITGSNGQTVSVSLPSDSAAGWEDGWTNQVFNPTTNPVLTAGTKYWLVFESTSTNSSNNWRVVRTPTDATYGSGTAKLDGDTSGMPVACAGSCDIAFRLNMGGVPPTLNIPVVKGTAYSHNITDTTMDKKAYYQVLSGTVKTDFGNDTCAEDENGPNCYDNAADQPAVNFPISDAEIAQFENQAAVGGTVDCSSTCTITDGTSIGPKKYDGDVILDGIVTLVGTVWVKGNLTIGNGAAIDLSDAYGSDSGIIIADNPDNPATSGRIIASQDAGMLHNATADTYVMAISMSTSIDSVSPAFDAQNNFCKATIHPDAACVVYVPHGIAVLSNNTELKEITSHTLYLKQNVIVHYETGLASVIFSSGPGGSWAYQRGTYQIID